MEKLDISQTRLRHFTLLEISGRIDMFTSHQLRDQLVKLYHKPKGIVVDLSDVCFMDSSGVATLVEGISWSRKTGFEFIIIGLGLNIYNAISLTKLEEIFNVRPVNPLIDDYPKSGQNDSMSI